MAGDEDCAAQDVKSLLFDGNIVVEERFSEPVAGIVNEQANRPVGVREPRRDPLQCGPIGQIRRQNLSLYAVPLAQLCLLYTSRCV